MEKLIVNHVSMRVLAIVLMLSFIPLQASFAGRGSTKAKGTVGIVFFSSRDCPVCTNVKRLTSSVRQRYPVRIKVFDIDKPDDYALFSRLEAIHSKKGFSIPLLMLGETILMGEDQITGKLERTVRTLAKSGGSPMPYLGRGKGSKPISASSKKSTRTADARNTASSRCPCTDRGRPPTISEEWNKVSRFLDRFF